MPPGGTPSTPSTAAPAPSSRWLSTAAPMQGAAPASTRGSPCWSAAPSRKSTSTGRPAPPTPPNFSTPSLPRFRPDCRLRRRPLGPSRPARHGTCSASRSGRRPRRAAPAPIPLPRLRPPTTGDRSPSSPSRPAPPTPLRTNRPRRRMPAPTIPGGRASRGCRARSLIPRRWCSPPPWPRCRIPCRPTGRCCPNAWLPTGSCRTPNSKASCSRARPIPAISPPTTASVRAGRPCSAARRTTATMATPPAPPMSPTTARCCPPRCASGAAGCSATAPARARAGRSPPSCSTTGCAAAGARSGCRSPTSWSRTQGATGARSAGARTT